MSRPLLLLTVLSGFFAMEQKLMANETLQQSMADYHELVSNGRREIYRVEP